jgi:hypothetical protein
MQIILFTLIAAALYLAANRIVLLLEARAGRRFENRSLHFFVILLVLALVTFALIRRYVLGG